MILAYDNTSGTISGGNLGVFIFILQMTKSFFIIFYSHLLSELIFCKAV